tara:strand:- start:2330 stop:2620 length:291 start_codon:yes stop_codon:yes gene_type:complete
MEAKLDEITRVLNKVLPVVEQHEAVERQREILQEEESKLASEYKEAFNKVAFKGIPDSKVSNDLLGSERDLNNKAKQHSSTTKVGRISTSSEERVG